MLASGIFIFGQIFNATTLATFSMLIIEFDRQSREAQAKMAFANEVMENLALTRRDKRLIRLFFISTEQTQQDQN